MLQHVCGTSRYDRVTHVMHFKATGGFRKSRLVSQRASTTSASNLQLRSKYFIPLTAEPPNDAVIASHKLLIQAGFVKKLASGIYTYLPLGLRTISKIVKIVDEEMESVDGQKINMPKLLPKELWEHTGRWNDMGSELIRLKDRKGEDFCLAPTHEEIVTSLVASGVSGRKQLPLRLYQIGDKYRDEARPRFGLLRAREFIMKDLYSFDETQELAMKTYDEVLGAYHRIMKRLDLPYAVAEADSGNIGGNLSHEFHALAEVGEDSLLCCPSNSYHANVEKAKSATVAKCDPSKIPQDLQSIDANHSDALKLLLQHFAQGEGKATIRATIFSDPQTPDAIWLALTDASYDVNHYLVKGHYKLSANFIHKTLDSEAVQSFETAKVKNVIFDEALVVDGVDAASKAWIGKVKSILSSNGSAIESGHVKIAKVGDACICNSESGCPGGQALTERKGIEVGHLFYLGTKYSVPLKALLPSQTGNSPIEMGCYGIGVSRLLAVSVESSHDADGIIWPLSIAPFKVMVVAKHSLAEKANEVFSQLSAIPSLRDEIMIDDRYRESPGMRIKQSTFIGIPYTVVLGSSFSQNQKVEVYLRKMGQIDEIPISELVTYFERHLNGL